MTIEDDERRLEHAALMASKVRRSRIAQLILEAIPAEASITEVDAALADVLRERLDLRSRKQAIKRGLS